MVLGCHELSLTLDLIDFGHDFPRERLCELSLQALQSDLVQRNRVLPQKDLEGTLEDFGPDKLFVENLSLLEDFSIEVEVVHVLLLCGVQTSTGVLLRLAVDTDQG